MKRLTRVLLLLLVVSLVLSAAACGCSRRKKKTTAPDTTAPVTTTPVTTVPPVTTPAPSIPVPIVSEGKTAYKLITPAKSQISGLSQRALELRSYFSTGLGASLPLSNDMQAPVSLEILLADTSRPETAAVAARLAETAGEAYFQYVIAETNGKLVLYADAAEGYVFLLDALKAFAGEKALTVTEGLFDRHEMTWQAYEEYLLRLEEEAAAKAEAERLARIEALKAENKSFRISDFGRIEVFDSYYASPEVYPTEGQHPRVFFTEGDLGSIRERILAEENEILYKNYIKYSEVETTGELKPPKAGSHNMSYGELVYIQAKALRYALEGNELYAQQAILAIKNYILTVDVPHNVDPNYCRRYGHVMYIAACVYDWCYDVMTPADRAHIVAGIQSRIAPNMEVGFPPYGQGGVTGHGSEAQLLRDWLAFGIATYDDYPHIYETIGGRMFEQFRDGQGYYMQSGSHWQGTNYGPYRTTFLLQCQRLFLGMTEGKLKFFTDDLRELCKTFLYYVRPDEQMWRIGDIGEGATAPRNFGTLALIMLQAGNLYGDPDMKSFALDYYGGELNFEGGGNMGNTAIDMLLANDPSVDLTKAGALPLVRYNGSPRGQIIARSAWDDENAVAVYMKIGESYSANHEHKDAGHFMIFYRGILASDSGAYITYGTKHDYAYHKQTIAHNSILVYNPGKTGTGAWVYSGGQQLGNSGENSTLATWMLKPTIAQAKILGHGYGISESGEYLYSYLAGDLANAYDADTVDGLDRYMVSVMTGDPENPMAFLVYDRITAVNANFKKTFLLHVQEEPELGDGFATAVNTLRGNSGKLHVQSLLTDVVYTKIGGEGNEFNVGGKNYPIEDDPSFAYSEKALNESGWGRIEISPKEPSLTDRLLTVMYVTDATNEAEMVRASEIRSDDLVGAEIFGKVVLFPSNVQKLGTSFSFTMSGEGERTYMIAGIASGQWSVTLNGEPIGGFVAADGDLLTFTAGCGELSLTPAFAPIEYVLNGGMAGKTPLPQSYNFGDAFALPTDLTKLGSEFAGWFTDEGCTVPFAGVTADMTAPVKVYAKWNKVFDAIHYEVGDGAIVGDYEIKHVLGKEYVLPTDVRATGKRFIGWYTDPDFTPGSALTVISADYPEGDITLYARYAKIYASYTANSFPKINNGSTTSNGDGMFIWNNPDGAAHFGFSNFDTLSERSLTMTFDMMMTESLMPFYFRLRPSQGNVFDQALISFKASGAITIGNETEPILYASDILGVHRFTLVISTDNAALQAGLEANAAGKLTSGDAYKSNMTVTLYLDGIYVGETTFGSFLTFGEGFTYSNGSKSFSTQPSYIQGYGGFTVTDKTPTSIMIGNLEVASGSLTVGGTHFLHIPLGGTPTGEYLDEHRIVSLPELTLDHASFGGWYTSPDLAPSSKITSLDGVPAATVIYADVDSAYEPLSYVLEGGILDAGAPNRYLPGQQLTLPTPTHEKGEFIGWYLDNDFRQPFTGTTAEGDGALTLYARFALTYYDSTGKKIGGSAVTLLEDGWSHWHNGGGSGNVSITSIGGFNTDTVTLSFMMRVTESPMRVTARLRPSSNNTFDTNILSITNVGFYLPGLSEPVATAKSLLGERCITLVLKNDNAGYEGGVALNATGGKANSSCASKLSIELYIDGVFIASTVVTTYQTFGCDYIFVGNNNQGVAVSCSSQTETIQFTSSFTPGEGVTDVMELKDMKLADGARTVGCDYYFVLGEGASIANEDHISDGRVVSLPELSLDHATLLGFFTDPGFAPESRVTSLDGLKKGTLLYVQTVSDYKKITYVLSGGEIVGEYPSSYLPGAEVILPTEVNRAASTFLGWYTDPNFKTRVERIEATETEPITLYARYEADYGLFTFDGSKLGTNSVQGGSALFGPVSTKTDVTYFKWVAPSAENGQNGYMHLQQGDSTAVHGTMSAQMTGTEATLSMRLRIDSEGGTPFNLRLRINGKATSLFGMNKEGQLRFGSMNTTDKPIGTVTDEWQTLKIVMTVMDGYISYTCTLGDAASVTYTNTIFSSFSDFKEFQFYSGSGATVDASGNPIYPATYIDDLALSAR